MASSSWTRQPSTPFDFGRSSIYGGILGGRRRVDISEAAARAAQERQQSSSAATPTPAAATPGFAGQKLKRKRRGRTDEDIPEEFEVGQHEVGEDLLPADLQDLPEMGFDPTNYSGDVETLLFLSQMDETMRLSKQEVGTVGLGPSVPLSASSHSASRVCLAAPLSRGRRPAAPNSAAVPNPMSEERRERSAKEYEERRERLARATQMDNEQEQRERRALAAQDELYRRNRQNPISEPTSSGGPSTSSAAVVKKPFPFRIAGKPSTSSSSSSGQPCGGQVCADNDESGAAVIDLGADSQESVVFLGSK